MAQAFFRRAAEPVLTIFLGLFFVGCIGQFHIRVP